MAQQHNGPSIIRDNLVFAYDADNGHKSFKGRKNLAKTSAGAKDWSLGNLTGAGISSTAVITNEKYRITCTTGGAFRWYFNVNNLTDGHYYTLSMKFKYNNNANSDFTFTDWNDQTITKKVEVLGDGVYKITATGVRGTYSSTYRFMDFSMDTSTSIDVWDIQLEAGTKATKYEKTLLSSNGGQLVDWAGGKSINLSSINYKTTGGFNFTAQSHNIAVDSNNFKIAKQKTLSIWIRTDRPLSANDNWEVGFLNQGSTQGSMFGWMYGVGPCQDLGFWGYGSAYDFSVTSTTNKWSSDGNWHNGVITMDSLRNVRGYVDGEPITWLRHSDNATAASFQMPIDTTNYFLINSRAAWNSGMSYVDLGNVMVYDRDLSAEEVKQNYNALKNRFS